MHIGRSALRPLLSKRRDPKELTRHAWANSVGSFCCAHYYDHFGGEPDRCWQCVAEQRPVPFPSPSPPPPLFFLSRKFERGDRLCDRSVDVLLRMILCGRVTVFFFSSTSRDVKLHRNHLLLGCQGSLGGRLVCDRTNCWKD